MDSKIVLYSQFTKKQWNVLVQTSTTATWFQTPEAYDFFASQSDVMETFNLGVRSAQGLRGVCVGYVTKEYSAFKQLFTRRAIIIGGPCLADDCTCEEAEILMTAVRKHLQSRAIYIETRNFNDFTPWRTAFKKAGFTYCSHLNFHVDCIDKEAMWNRLSDNRKRQIKRAIQQGAYIEEAQNEQEISEWYKILETLYCAKVKKPLFPLSFFLEFYRQKKGKYLLVKHNGKVIGGIMCPILGEKCVYEWYVCGADETYKYQYPSVMATYAAMEYACKHGFARFDFMGAGKQNEAYGVRDFKARFGGQEVEYGRWLCVNKPILYKFGELGVKMLRR